MALVIVGVLACASCATATPLVRACTLRLGLIDQPDGLRKLHGRATALGGGVAVLIGLALALSAAWFVPALSTALSLTTDRNLAPLGLASLAIVLLGLVDDRLRLRGSNKLIGQMIIVASLVASGAMIERVRLFDVDFDLGYLAAPLSVFWLIGTINALNLIDGIDGLATSVGATLSTAVGMMALLNGYANEAVMAFALAGSLLGFLCFNFPPAKIFLGDAGSMLIGLVVI